MLKVLIAGISFRAKDETGHFFPEDEKFFAEAEKGVSLIVKKVCGLEIPSP